LTGAPTWAQDFEIAVPHDQLTCFAENREAYLDVPRPILEIFPSLCPATGEEAAANLALNSGGETAEVPPGVLITKSEFRCLVSKIDAHLEKAGDGDFGEDADAVVFVLDCKG
jgi:hypothetical protein